MPYATSEQRKEYRRNYYQKNKEKIKADTRRNSALNRESKRLYAQKYYRENIEKCKVRQRKYNEKNPHVSRISRLRTYGLTIDQWEDLFNKQGRKCAGCTTDNPNTKRKWHTDHDHKTGKVRGILCHKCNVTLGNVDDNITILQGLISYLQSQPIGELK